MDILLPYIQNLLLFGSLQRDESRRRLHDSVLTGIIFGCGDTDYSQRTVL